jgi:hypothetical protein
MPPRGHHRGMKMRQTLDGLRLQVRYAEGGRRPVGRSA